eukprot:g14354.t2
MAEISGDAVSAAAAAAANVAISQTVSAMLDSASTSAAVASAVPRMPQEFSGLDASSMAAAGIAETVSSVLESATTAAVAVAQDEQHQTAVASPRASASAPGTTAVPPLSPLGPTEEHTASGIGLSGRRSHDDEEDSETDELKRSGGTAADVADGSQDSRGQFKPVVISDAGRVVYGEVGAKSDSTRGANESKAAGKETIGVRQERKETKEDLTSKDVGEDAVQKKEKRLELPEDSNDRAVLSSRCSSIVVGGNERGTDRSKGSKSTPEDIAEPGDDSESRHSGGRADGESEAAGENPTAPNVRPSAAASRLTKGDEGIQQQWHWWDSENPWSRGPRSFTSTEQKSTGRKLSDTVPAPPAYQETIPPPPYQEVIAGLPSRSPTQKLIIEQQERALSYETSASNERDPRPVSALSNDASSSSGDATSRGPPPSYRAAVVGETASQSSPSDREEEKQNSTAAHLPPPSYGRFYGDFRSTTSPLQRETSSIGPKSDGGEWWTLDDQDAQYAPVWSGGGRGEERERGRRRTRASSGGDGGGGLQNPDRPETIGGEHEEETFGGTSWHRQRSSEGRRRRTATAGGSSRPRTTMSQPRGKGGKKHITMSGTESWDGDRWRLTRYLQSCKRELAEAEERRRRAEAAANAAERNAWAAGKSKGGDDDGAKRAWARAATQRVLDLMLVTERVRQEEQKRRVTAARARTQVARCRQPFRERRGRSQKGAFIGPNVPPADVLDPPSRQNAEVATMRDIYWDEHGRRYSRRGSNCNGVEEHEKTAGEVGVALDIVRKVAGACLEEGLDFAQPFREIDSDADGRLTLAELGAALRRAGARLSLSQVTALFRHFDEGLGLDTVGRGQFLWEFVDTKRLLEQWRTAGDLKGGHRALMAPFRSRAKKASYGGGRGGGDEGMLSRHDVLRSLEELGVHVDGWEAGALLDRFAAEDGNNNVDWVAFISFMQAKENKGDNNNSSDNGGTIPNRGNKSTARARRERAGLCTSLPCHSRHHQRHWATSGLHRGGGLFETKGDVTTRVRPTRPTGTTTTNASSKSHFHWASSAPSSAAGGWRTEDSTGNVIYPARPKPRTGYAEGRSSSSRAAIIGSSSLPPSLRSRVPRGERGAGGGGLVTNVAEASRMLDGLLENQQELEAFLEEEIAKREAEGGGGGGGGEGGGGGGGGGGRGGFARRQGVDW